MDFAKFDLLEQKVALILTRLADAESAGSEADNALAEARRSLAETAGKLADSENALRQAEDQVKRLQSDNAALAEIQESAKSKINDLLAERQTVLARVETLLSKLD
ncbi:MAG: hypothetical protein LBP95_04365 [Deltaproteobacteria bacterium]|jgi:chromosome segregation ATPase|nr:hypothetical protein [Deltaproteobacteria bacterium]